MRLDSRKKRREFERYLVEKTKEFKLSIEPIRHLIKDNDDKICKDSRETRQ